MPTYYKIDLQQISWKFNQNITTLSILLHVSEMVWKGDFNLTCNFYYFILHFMSHQEPLHTTV